MNGALWQDTTLPAGKILVPGVVSHATNDVEYPELVAHASPDTLAATMSSPPPTEGLAAGCTRKSQTPAGVSGGGGAQIATNRLFAR